MYKMCQDDCLKYSTQIKIINFILLILFILDHAYNKFSTKNIIFHINNLWNTFITSLPYIDID